MDLKSQTIVRHPVTGRPFLVLDLGPVATVAPLLGATPILSRRRLVSRAELLDAWAVDEEYAWDVAA